MCEDYVCKIGMRSVCIWRWCMKCLLEDAVCSVCVNMKCVECGVRVWTLCVYNVVCVCEDDVRCVCVCVNMMWGVCAYVKIMCVLCSVRMCVWRWCVLCVVCIEHMLFWSLWQLINSWTFKRLEDIFFRKQYLLNNIKIK